MNDFLEAAVSKLSEGAKSCGGSQHIAVMKQPVKEALTDFCRQDNEFAQAVVQGGSFSDCMAAVAKNAGSAISDIEAYGRAVSFYFPGAKIHVTMTIDLCGNIKNQNSSAGLCISLDSFL